MSKKNYFLFGLSIRTAYECKRKSTIGRVCVPSSCFLGMLNLCQLEHADITKYYQYGL